MQRLLSRPWLLLRSFAFLALLALPPRARADDWPQFRRDAKRSAASKDPVHLPLMELWSRRSELRGGMTTAAISHERIFFISGERGVDSKPFAGRSLCCADAATGTILWRKSFPLRPEGRSRSERLPQDGVGPAVSESGTVFAQGSILLPPSLGAENSRYDELSTKLWPFAAFGAFRAVDGQPVAYLPVLYQRYNRQELDRSVPIFYLQRGHWDGIADVIAPPTPAIAESFTSKWTYFGHPLILGEQLAALNMVELLIQWTPGRAGWAGPATYLRVRHPLPGVTDPDLMQWPVFAGRPMALAPNGLVIGEDMTNRFLSVIPPGAQSQWHRDMPWMLGIPAVGEQFVFTGAGGPGAIGAIMAFNAGTGEVGWTFPPLPLAADTASPVSWTGKGVAGSNGMATVRVPNTMSQPVTPRSQRPVVPPGQTGRDPVGAQPATVTRPYWWLYYPQVFGPGVLSDLPTGWWTNPGLAIAGGRVYGIAKVRSLPTVVALDEQTGMPVWQQPLPLRTVVHSVVASKDHVFVSMDDRLLALKLDDGKPEWSRLMPAGGELELSKGLVFLSTADTLHAFAPAERTYSLAVDSGYASDYPPDAKPSTPGPVSRPAADAAPDAPRRHPLSPDPLLAGAPPEAADSILARRPLADATILRLRWPADVEELARQAKARREAAGKLPMLVELDWTHLPGQSSIVDRQMWDGQHIAAFAAACAELAKAAHPEHLNIAPEVNAYLCRYPDQTDAVQALIALVKPAVEKASPGTRVLISFNVEVLRGVYRSGRYRPFGDLASPKEQTRVAVQPLVSLVDEVGLTSRPQSAYGKAEEIPGDYLLAAKEALGDKPLLITGIEARMDTDDRMVALEQALFVRRLLQLCYWLDASIVAYPNAAADAKSDRSALMVSETARPSLAAWAEALSWKKVEKLTLIRQNQPEAEQTEPGAERE